MQKTLIITYEYPPQIGGIASYINGMNEVLPKEKIVVLAPDDPKAEEFDKQKDYKIIRKKMSFGLLWPRWLKLFFQVSKIIKQEKIESIMVHHALPAGYVAYLIYKIKKIPYIVFLHGTDFFLAKKNKRKLYGLQKVLNLCQKVVVNSNWLKNEVVSVFGHLSQKITLVYPCPEKEFFLPKSEEEIKQLRHRLGLEGKRVIISASRIAEGKGFPHLIRILADLVRKMPHLVLLIVGDGPKKDKVISIIQEENLQNNVRYLGNANHHELKQYFDLAELFILLTHKDTTRGEEGFGMVYLEAQAAGLPVVAGKSGGVGETFVNGETGIIVDSYDYEQTMESIIQLLQNNEYRQHLSDNARIYVNNNFLWEKQVEKINF